LIAEGLGEEPSSASDTSRFSNPFFTRSFGDYDLLEEVARGGMGVIYKAKQRSLGRVVAVKVLLSGEFASPEYVRRFQAEAEVAARLQHPNIVAIHEVGRQDGVRYFSMDYVEGPNLAQLLGVRPLSPERAAGYLKTIAEAIHYAHRQGVLHRDLKPSNVLIDPFGEPRVTDFGLAREISGDSDITTTGQVLGTPGFLPPEQADATIGPLSPASDVYSLGAILYFMLTARAPFGAGSLRETLRQVLHDEPVAPRLLNPEAPRDLETICLKCLERDAGRRYQTAAALAEDLRRFLAHEPILARPVSPAGRLKRWCRRRPALAVVWFLVVALAVGSTASAFLISRSLRQTQRAEAAGRERLRDARLAEARALRSSTVPGRRDQALAALAEAAQVRPGADLRDEALSALMQPDLKRGEQWDLNPGVPAQVWFDSGGTVGALETRHGNEAAREPAGLFHWGDAKPFGAIGAGPTNSAVGPLRFSADAALVMARFSDDTLRVWRVGETNPFTVVSNRPAPGGLTPVAEFNDDYDFSPDGKMFALGLPGDGLSLNRVEDGAEIARWQGGHSFSTVKFAPDGRRVAATCVTKYKERQVLVFDVPDLGLSRTLELKGSPWGFAWASDGRILAVPTDESAVELFDMRDGRLLKSLVCPDLGSGEIFFLGCDSLLAYRGSGATIYFANPGLAAGAVAMGGCGPSGVSARASSDAFVFTSLEAVATRWAVERPTGLRVIPAPRPGGLQMGMNSCCLDFSPDGRWVVSGHGRFTIIRDAVSGRLTGDLDTGDPKGMEFGTVAFCDKGRGVLRQSTGTGLRRYAVDFDEDGSPRFGAYATLDTEPGFLITDRVADGRRLALVDVDRGVVKIVDVAAGAAKIVARWEESDVYAAALSPDGEMALVNCAANPKTGATNKVRLHRVSSGAVARELDAAADGEVGWSADGKTAMTSNGQKLSILWDAKLWSPVTKLEGRLGGNITAFALAPDGSSVVVSRDESVYIVEPRSGAVLARLEMPGSSGLAAGIRFLPDGRRIAVLWRDGRIDIIDPDALRQGLKPLGLAW
jgi:WD40 repeat protein